LVWRAKSIDPCPIFSARCFIPFAASSPIPSRKAIFFTRSTTASASPQAYFSGISPFSEHSKRKPMIPPTEMVSIP